MERNSSLTAVHTLSCMLCTQSFTVKWLGTELVRNFLTKLTFFIQENAVTWKVSHVQMSFLVSDLPSHPNLMRAKWLGNSPGVGVEIQVPSPAVSQQWGDLTSKCLPLSSALVGAVIPCASNRQCTTKRERKGVLVTFPRVTEGTKHNKTHISSQYPDHGLFYSIALPPSYPAERIWYKRSAYSELWGRDLKLQIAVLLALQASPKSKGIQQHLNHFSVLEKSP